MAEQRKGKGGGAAHGLVGGGPSNVGVSGAMRARDVSRPRPADEAAAAKKPIRRRPPDPPSGEPRTR